MQIGDSSWHQGENALIHGIQRHFRVDHGLPLMILHHAAYKHLAPGTIVFL